MAISKISNDTVSHLILLGTRLTFSSKIDTHQILMNLSCVTIFTHLWVLCYSTDWLHCHDTVSFFTPELILEKTVPKHCVIYSTVVQAWFKYTITIEFHGKSQSIRLDLSFFFFKLWSSPSFPPPSLSLQYLGNSASSQQRKTKLKQSGTATPFFCKFMLDDS